MEKQIWDMLIIKFMMQQVMKFINRSLIVLMTTLLACSCKYPQVKNAAVSNWTSDSCGCKNKRTEALANKLIEENGLMNSNKNKFLNVFGSPNEVKKDGDYDILIYYFGTICDNNKPSLGSDTCFAKFYFKSGDLTHTAFNVQ